ncbi:MAG: hypothetical protein WEB88_18045, partial [Gemmatimonadota bacterium]
MLAYTFWHWPRAGVAPADYERRQAAFHQALAEHPPAGFLGSATAAVTAPWADGYEDWYRVEDYAALGTLNEAAVSHARAASHDAAAALAEGGAGGLYALRAGEPTVRPTQANWFTKPAGMAHSALIEDLGPLVERHGGALWMRQLVLGPAPEFCLQATSPIRLPAALDVLRL